MSVILQTNTLNLVGRGNFQPLIFFPNQFIFLSFCWRTSKFPVSLMACSSASLLIFSIVAIVTSASSHIGAAICRVLLRHNALVLGVDSIPIHKSLNAGAGTHFQFLQYEGGEVDLEEKILEVSRLKFGLERVDVLVCLEGRGDHNEHSHGEMGLQQVRLIEEMVGPMKESGGGIMLNIIGERAMQAGGSRGDGTEGIHLVSTAERKPFLMRYCSSRYTSRQAIRAEHILFRLKRQRK
jgi:hypothetical protein